MGLYRDDATIVQWLHMSKYPPALVYSLMELGLMALLLVVFMRFERRMRGAPNRWNPLLVFGQTALFFYMLHFVLLGGSAIAITGGMMLRGLPETYAATGAVLVLLYPTAWASAPSNTATRRASFNTSRGEPGGETAAREPRAVARRHPPDQNGVLPTTQSRSLPSGPAGLGRREL